MLIGFSLFACQSPEDGGALPRDTATDAPSGPYTTAFHIDMVVVEAGTFTMGSGPSDTEGYYRDHEVELTRSYWIGQSEVTQAQWAHWVETPDPSHWSGRRLPVEQVSWGTAARYTNALSAEEGLPSCYEADGSAMLADYLDDPAACEGYRLPTEAEWEFAARAGEDTRFPGSDDALEVAWYGDNAEQQTHEVCLLELNALGLCDMAGNVFEWTNDWFSYTYGGYGDGRRDVDPAGPDAPEDPGEYLRAGRGGCYNGYEVNITPSARYGGWPDQESSCMGFRVARTMPEP